MKKFNKILLGTVAGALAISGSLMFTACGSDKSDGEKLYEKTKGVYAAVKTSISKSYTDASSKKKNTTNNYKEVDAWINLAPSYSLLTEGDLDEDFYASLIGFSEQVVRVFEYIYSDTAYSTNIQTKEETDEYGGVSKIYYQTKAKSENEFEINMYSQYFEGENSSFNGSYQLLVKYDFDNFEYTIDAILSNEFLSGSQVLALQIAKEKNSDSVSRFIYTSISMNTTLQNLLGKENLDDNVSYQGGDFNLSTMKGKEGNGSKCWSAYSGIKNQVIDQSSLKNM